MLSYGGLEEVLKLLYLDLSPLSFLPKVMVVNNIGPGCLADPNYCRQPIPLIAQPLSESPNCAWQWVAPVLDQGNPPLILLMTSI